MPNNKQKGSTFERKIAKQLSLWYSDGSRDDIFGRSVTSGGWATTRAKKGQEVHSNHGDITALDPIGFALVNNVCIELKCGYKNWSIMDALDKPKKSVSQQFEKFIDQASAHTDPFWLITKKDRRNTLITMPHWLYTDYKEWFGQMVFPYIATQRLTTSIHTCTMCLDDFLCWASASYYIDSKGGGDD